MLNQFVSYVICIIARGTIYFTVHTFANNEMLTITRSSSKLSSSRDTSSDTSSMSDSSADERKSKTLGRKELITGGLASVATIHAAHSVYQSVHARKVRQKAVREGKISPEAARKKKNKDRLQDAARVGIAALGIRGAISEWKELKESREEHLKFEAERQKRHEKRLQVLEDRIKRNEQQRQRQQDTVRPKGIDYIQSDPGLANGNYPQTVSRKGPHWNGPHYADGNPYAAEGIPSSPIAGYQPRY